MPTKTKPKADEIFVALFSWVGNDYGVAEGTRLRGDNEMVQRFPDRFVPADTPDDELKRLRAALNAPLPRPERLTGRFKLRVLEGQGFENRGTGEPQHVMQGGRTYFPGQTLEAEGADAEHLIGSGVCEMVRRLRPKKAQAEPLAAPGLTTATGRTVA